MKRDNKTKWSLAFFALLLIQLMVSCETQSVLPETPKDYFPLSDNFHVNYLKENILGGENETVWASDTVTLTVLADTLVEGMPYKKIINDFGMLDKIVRKEGS